MLYNSLAYELTRLCRGCKAEAQVERVIKRELCKRYGGGKRVDAMAYEFTNIVCDRLDIS